jgi:multisubunit Na+/H+ antiporter MnhG subunit
MQSKRFFGWILVVIGGLGLLRLLAHFQVSSSAMGGLTAGILFVLVGVWLIRSSRTTARR